MITTHLYGGAPVPWTVSWTHEEGGFFLAPCPWAGAIAIHQPIAPGHGRPKFVAPHAQRQRHAIAAGLCDLCGEPLAARTKVSLSNARMVPHGADGVAILQVEPLLHRPCAAISARRCPALKRDIANRIVNIRTVGRYRVQFALMDADYVQGLTGERRAAVGHAKVELLSWRNRDLAWLGL